MVAKGPSSRPPSARAPFTRDSRSLHQRETFRWLQLGPTRGPGRVRPKGPSSRRPDPRTGGHRPKNRDLCMRPLRGTHSEMETSGDATGELQLTPTQAPSQDTSHTRGPEASRLPPRARPPHRRDINTNQPDRCDSSPSWVAVRLCQAAQATACSAPTLRRPPMTTALPQARWRGSAADTSPALPTWTPRQQQRRQYRSSCQRVSLSRSPQRRQDRRLPRCAGRQSCRL